jgi:putative ABC transport system permease protein
MKRSLRSWLWRVPLNQEVDDELAFHIEMRARELIARGIDPATARDQALSRIGDLERLKRTCVDIGRKRDRDMRLTQWIDELRDDVRFAARQLTKARGFTCVAAATLALGIGANSAIFALADATLMRPLPYAEPDRLVMIWERSATNRRMAVAPLNLRDWNEQNRTFDRMAAISLGLGGGPMLAAPDGTTESVERQIISSGFFDALGVKAVAGRTFLPTDEGPKTSVVVLSEGLWRTRFGGDLSLIGRDLRVNGQPHTVVGVVPNNVRFARPASIWTLLPELGVFKQRDLRMFEVVGRLKPGVTLEAAQADLSVIADRLAREHPDTNKGLGVTVVALRTGIIGSELQRTAVFLLGVVAFVLLMCCANVANLLLSRASARGRELAVRTALGAGRARIVRQLLTESLVLAALGGALGVGVGAAILQAAPAFIPAGLLPPAVTLTFDGRVVTFCAAAALAVGVLFGLMPAWQATGSSLVHAIAADNRSITQDARGFRAALASGEVAAAVLLLCGAGLLLRTMLVLGSFDAGYRADGNSVLTLDFSVPQSRYSSAQALLHFYQNVERQVSALPGMHSVGWASSLPWGSTELGRWPFEIVGDPPLTAANRRSADVSVASPGYFRTLDIRIVTGRLFTDRDTGTTSPVCIVNEAFARRYLHGRNPIGARVDIRPKMLGWTTAREIVGVARQVKGEPDESADLLQVYVPLAQAPIGDVFLVVRSAAGSPEALAPAIRAAVARHDANVPVRRFRTLDDLAGEATARYRFRAIVAATFAGLALLLAMVGVFGVLAYSVQQRRREFGVRIALGATTGNVLALVLTSAIKVIMVGAVIGLIGAAALARSISTFLHGVRPLDPLTFGAVAAVLTVTAALATIGPALRAARVDPVVAFRNDG